MKTKIATDRIKSGYFKTVILIADGSHIQVSAGEHLYGILTLFPGIVGISVL